MEHRVAITGIGLVSSLGDYLQLAVQRPMQGTKRSSCARIGRRQRTPLSFIGPVTELSAREISIGSATTAARSYFPVGDRRLWVGAAAKWLEC